MLAIQTEIYADQRSLKGLGVTAPGLRRLLTRIGCIWRSAAGLLVVLCITPGSREIHGRAFPRFAGRVGDKLREFIGNSIKTLPRHGPLPEQPDSPFDLVLLKFGAEQGKYPSIRSDRYGWSFRLRDFQSHVALACNEPLAREGARANLIRRIFRATRDRLAGVGRMPEVNATAGVIQRRA